MVGYGANKGIIPIACNKIFERISGSKDTNPNVTYEVQVSMLEIYNEKVQDLLIDSSLRPPTGMKVRENKLLGPYVEGLTKYPVTTYEEIANKMDEGNENRTIGSTLMNATSSRAHTIITIEFKQIETEIGKPKSEKLSVINLVDLAGSERSSSTGATGSRLKEGCNINKSLLVLGNVINTLADKATGGKNKNMLPPYRDSNLTRILQSALGGNSKTVMICALSPADINYEETLSTLRYADRAKKIQNKAVINESEQDKMVRLLKEENHDLKKKLDQVLNNLSRSGGVASEDDKKKAFEIKDEYEANLKLMESMQKTFQEKLEDAKKQEKSTIGDSVDQSKPHLVVINEDPQLSHKLKYSLTQLPIHVGRKQGNPKPKIALSGVGIKVNHAYFDEDKITKKIKLIPKDPQASEYITINGKPINPNGSILMHMDKIIFGSNTFMLFLHSSNGQELYTVDWETIYNQQQEEQERQNLIKEQEKEKQKQIEIEQLKSRMEEKFSREKKQMEENLKKQLLEYENKLKNVSDSDERAKLSKKKASIAHILNDENMINTIKEKLNKQDKNLFVKAGKEETIVHNSEKFESYLVNLAKKVIKTRLLIQKMNRNYHVELFLNKSIEYDYYLRNKNKITNKENSTTSLDSKLSENSDIVVLIRVENYEEGEVYYWAPEVFNNRYTMLNEYYEENEDLFSEGQDVKVEKEEDPLWDNVKQSLIGYAFISLKPSIYSIPVSSHTCVFSVLNSQKNASINFNLDYYDDNNERLPQLTQASFESQKGKSLKIKVSFGKIEEMNDIYGGKVSLEYQGFGDVEKTNITSKDDVLNKHVVIDSCSEHMFNIQNEDDYAYINEESLIVKVFGIEKIAKRGKLSKRLNIPLNNIRLVEKDVEDYQNRGTRSKTINDKANLSNNEVKKDKCVIF